MAKYSKTTGWKLFIGASVTVPPVAPASDTFSQVLNVQKIKEGAIVQQASSYHVLESPDAQSNGGSIGDIDWTTTVFHDEALTPHQTLRADALTAGGQQRNYRVEKPNGKRHDFVGFVTQFNPSEAEASGEAAPPADVALTIRQVGAATVSNIP